MSFMVTIRPGSDEPEEMDEPTAEVAETRFWSGGCEECGCEWHGIEDQNCCPCCGNIAVDLMEEDAEGDGIIEPGLKLAA